MYVGALVRQNVQDTCMQYTGKARTELAGAKFPTWFKS